MLTKWTDHLSDPKEKEKFINKLRGNREILDRLLRIYQQDLAELNSYETTLKTYETPSWSAKQAHINGDRSRLMRHIKLVDLDQQKDDK